MRVVLFSNLDVCALCPYICLLKLSTDIKTIIKRAEFRKSFVYLFIHHICIHISYRNASTQKAETTFILICKAFDLIELLKESDLKLKPLLFDDGDYCGRRLDHQQTEERVEALSFLYG